ncbi:hypothetical protein [Ensifer sp. LCM 4579]|uniref:hypothetical protein n=1 Tax=Ensifer sp. LCM 4579 TaxID=1848292 RepID=UPI000AE62ABE|nr:hypothetical protein [Ensifer sp. LCM 4579]
MSVKERIKRYWETGGAADLVRVEVLVPRARREEIVNIAAEFRSKHRAKKDRLAEFIRIATERYVPRVFDNIDIDKLNDLPQKARVIMASIAGNRSDSSYIAGGLVLWTGPACPITSTSSMIPMRKSDLLRMPTSRN